MTNIHDGAVVFTATPENCVRLTCWGTRGSVPSPGPATVRHGGNTACVELRMPGGRRLILDAGTGIVGLGNQLARHAQDLRVDLFLSHFHWDHIQGLPFFAPLYDPAWTIRIHSCVPNVDALLAAQMSEPFFPVRMGRLAARVEYHVLEPAIWRDDDVEVTPFRVRHPGHTCGFRVRCRGATIVYIPDNEPGSREYELAPTWDADLLAFLRGADVLLHDAMFTSDEYAARRGWGHGTFEQAVSLAEAAAVPHLLLFHHAPERSDAELDDIVGRLRAELAARGSGLSVEAAAEGRELEIPALEVPA